ncbi:MAG: aminoacyl-tRNA hydrolase [Candidatus Sungbacteria bacterium]|nr:aminoacyl-tRNA hydrolase [Candidatus Sungbacteria bacterium]
MKSMYIFAGLGNPGEEYKGTRHNIGREILAAAAKKLGLADFKFMSKLQALAAEGKIAKEKAVFLLPETFMNKSGSALAPALKLYKIKPKNLVVVHDDADMVLGRTKLSFGRNSGGHKGVESVMRALKTKEFWRMRIGIQKKKRIPGEDLVLQKFRAGDRVAVKKISAESLRAIEEIAARGPERAMSKYNA